MVQLKTYSGEDFGVLGQQLVRAQVDNLPLIVVKGNGPSHFARHRLEKIRIDWAAVKTLVTQGPLDILMLLLWILEDSKRSEGPISSYLRRPVVQQITEKGYFITHA